MRIGINGNTSAVASPAGELLESVSWIDRLQPDCVIVHMEMGQNKHSSFSIYYNKVNITR